MLGLFSKSRSNGLKAAEWLAENGDSSVVPAFGETLYFMNNLNEVIGPLHKLTGKHFKGGWPDLLEWIVEHEIEPHPAYPHFKQAVLAGFDPAFRQFLNPAFTSRINLAEVAWGGVRKDGIPPLDNPGMIAVDAVDYLKDKDPVFGLSINGETHAYPLRILDWHELLNTTIGGKSVTLVYCTLCGAAIAYDGQIGETTYTFGTSGLLYRSNKLMYDRSSNSLWSSLDGQPVIGTLADQELTLKTLPVVRSTWKEWRELHPNTKVLDINTGVERNYRGDSPYKNYFDSPNTMFPVPWKDKRLKAKDWVFGIHVDSVSKAFPLKRLRKDPVIMDRVNDLNLVLIADSKALTVRAYRAGNNRFEKAGNPQQLRDQDGGFWTVEEDFLRNESGETLRRYSGHLAYWFAWYAFFPKTELWDR